MPHLFLTNTLSPYEKQCEGRTADQMAGINNKHKNNKQSSNMYPLSHNLRKLPSDWARKKPSHKNNTSLEQGTGGTVGWVLL